jgi:hypothetical protein
MVEIQQERLDSDWAWTRQLNISAGVKLCDTVNASGTAAFDSEGNVIGEDSWRCPARARNTAERRIDGILIAGFRYPVPGLDPQSQCNEKRTSGARISSGQTA